MIDLLIPQRRRDLGGFEVGRVLPFPQRRMVGPFIFLDEMGPVDFPAGIPRKVDVRPHPHIGLATLTYLFSGEITHRDSLGSHQDIRPGEVNWMTAGRGISHSERFERARAEGLHLHGLQAWVALPREDEESAPAFSHHPSAQLPQGEEAGKRWQLAEGAQIALPDEHPERAVYVVDGELECGTERIGSGHMAVFAAGRQVSLRATRPTLAVAIGGEPVGERYIDWNFVSSSRERIEQAKADWRAQRFPLPPDDREEFIPLPEGKG